MYTCIYTYTPRNFAANVRGLATDIRVVYVYIHTNIRMYAYINAGVVRGQRPRPRDRHRRCRGQAVVGALSPILSPTRSPILSSTSMR